MKNLENLLAEATPGPWAGHNMVHADGGRQMTPEEIGEYVCNSVKMGCPDRFLFVSGKHEGGGDVDVCHTGNGPRGPANTALIALAPSLAAALLVAEKVLRVHSERLRHCSTNIVDEYPVWSGDLLKMAEDADAALSEIARLTGGSDDRA